MFYHGTKADLAERKARAQRGEAKFLTLAQLLIPMVDQVATAPCTDPTKYIPTFEAQSR